MAVDKIIRSSLKPAVTADRITAAGAESTASRPLSQAHFSFWHPTEQELGQQAINFRNGTLLRYGDWSDWRAIESLRQAEGDALGFVPKQRYESILSGEFAPHWRSQNVLVTTDNEDLTGFCYVSYASSTARIFQIVVRSDARRWHRALLMIDAIEEKARATLKAFISCRVAVDLESNFFWSGIGFALQRQVTSTWLNQRESKSKRPLNVYRKVLQ